jgi:hypothetical protein
VNKLTLAVLFAGTLAVATIPAWSQATWEGPTGVFLNPLALTAARGTSQVSTHFLDLEPYGSLTSVGYTYSGGNWEAGVTRANLSAGGTSGNTDIYHAKWVALPFKGEAPQVALGAIVRTTHGGDTTTDFYGVATKVFPTRVPIIASLTVRNTNGLGTGLFGKADKRTTEFGGFLGVQAASNLIAGIEYYEQPEVSPWRDLAVRWIVSPDTFIDAGLADLNETFDNQLAVALTHQW